MIFVVPAPCPVTTPVEGSTVAIKILALLHAPVAELPLTKKLEVEPIQIGDVPAVTVPAEALGLTVMEAEAVAGLLQPVLTV